MTPVEPSAKIQIRSILILILFSILIYSNSLKGSFHFDDRNLIDREWIADLKAFNKNVRLQEYENRPVLLWTLALNNTLHKNNVFGFHLFNLLLHVCVSTLIFFIAVQTQNIIYRPVTGTSPPTSGITDRISSTPSLQIPLIASLLFAVHPLNTDSVSYISSRSSVLATFFYLLSVYAFLRVFPPYANRWRMPVGIGWGLLTLGGMYLAIASKLIAVTLPALLVLWFLFFICPVRFPQFKTWFISKKTIAVYGGVPAILSAAFLLLKPEVLYAPKDQGLVLFGRVPYLLIETKVVVFYYLKSFFAPVNLNVDIGFPFTTFFTDPKIPLAMLGIGALIYFSWQSRSPWVRVSVLWFFLTLAPTSSLVPLNDLAVEHRMYLPMTLGLCLAAGWTITKIPARWRSSFLMTTLVLLASLTISRNLVWTTEVRLWQDAAKKNPFSPRTHNNLGKAYYENGQIDKALFHFKKSNEAIETHLVKQYNLANPEELLKRQTGNQPKKEKDASSLKIIANLAEPHYNLASVYLDKGNLEQAESEYQTALRLNPNYFSALLGLGSVYARMEKFQQAVASYRQAIHKRQSATGAKDYPLARLNLGEIYGRTGKFEDAIRELSLAVKHDPSLVLGHYNLGLAYLMTGSLEKAEQTLTTGLALNDRFEPALFNLARVIQAKGEWERSTRQFERFLQVKGADAGAYFQIGWNHQQAGNLDKARESYEKALTIDPEFLHARINLGKIYLESQQNDLARMHLLLAAESKPPEKLMQEISRLLLKLS
ncbi:MAG: hypothetical protein NPINA01_17280 [Nitrospinaceae bacterium]|nr:MAG: hypothetical protein NPINA01_17280 [Nitrospinaceae bacterium]